MQSDPIGLDGGISTYGYAGAQPLTNIDPSGLRPPNADEAAVIKSLFGDCFDSSSVDIAMLPWGSGRPISPIGNKVWLPRDNFIGGYQSLSVDFSRRSVRGNFAHEMFHVWQRRQGANVTAVGLSVQIPYGLSIYGTEPYLGFAITDPYMYADMKDPAVTIEYFNILFDTSSYEAQAAMFEDLYLNSGRSAFDAQRWNALSSHVKSLSSCGCKK